VPHRPWITDALAKGNTLPGRSCVHWVNQPLEWLAAQQKAGTMVVGVELADGAIRLADLPAARCRTVAVLGHEREGIPRAASAFLDAAVEIPMIGSGQSLNVAVAGALVAYKLAGLV
jgi:tRNA (guanosine-2'-O-)-methyltransferase